MGYSDTSVTHCVCRQAGLVSFYGPSFMSGFAESGGMSRYLVDSVYQTLFCADPIGVLSPNEPVGPWKSRIGPILRTNRSGVDWARAPEGSSINGKALPRASCSADASKCWIGSVEPPTFPR